MVDAGHLRTLAAYGSSRSIRTFSDSVGHCQQSPDWTFEGTGELTLNLFTPYVLERLCGIVGTSDAWTDRDRSKDELTALDDIDDPSSGSGDEPRSWPGHERAHAGGIRLGGLPESVRGFRALPDAERPKYDDEERDRWLVRFLRQAGCNPGPFLETWGVSASQAARDSIPAYRHGCRPTTLRPRWTPPSPCR